MVLLAAYAPGDRHPREITHIFWHALQETRKHIRARRHLIAARGFNAHLGTDRPTEWAGATGGPAWNDKGRQLYDMAIRFQLRILNTFGGERATGPPWLKPGSDCDPPMT